MNTKYFYILLFLASSSFCEIVDFSKKICPDKECIDLANDLKDEGKLDEAIWYYKFALDINPDNVNANFALAFESYKKRDYENAFEYFKKLSEIKPNDPSVLYNFGYLLFHKKFMIPEAIDMFERYVNLQPNDMRAREFLCDAYLKAGMFAAAFAERRMLNERDIALGRKKGISNMWEGEHLNGKTILIKDDIGIGDLFLWVRYAKLFKQQGANVIVQVRKHLLPILSKCKYINKLLPRGERIPYFDYQAGVGQLHHRINQSIDDIYRYGAGIPYIYPDEKLVKKWEEKISAEKRFKVGICWAARPYINSRTGKEIINPRSMLLKYFYPLSKIEGISLYSLQQRNGAEQLKTVPKDFDIHIFDYDFDKTHGSFMDTAAVMKNLDLVITVDTSIAHLAGAMGVSVWVVLPFVSDWRWLLGRSDSPWYPTMRLFRQQSPDGWKFAIDEVVIELRKILKLEEKWIKSNWSISEDLFNYIRRILPEGRTILELGSGWGTGQLSKFYTVYSIEHDKRWLDKYDSNYIYASIKNRWYDAEILRKELPKKYDLILVDGPTGGIGRGGFYQNLDLFNTDVVMIFDDVHRQEEYDLMVTVATELNKKFTVSDQDKYGRKFGVVI